MSRITDFQWYKLIKVLRYHNIWEWSPRIPSRKSAETWVIINTHTDHWKLHLADEQIRRTFRLTLSKKDQLCVLFLLLEVCILLGERSLFLQVFDGLQSYKQRVGTVCYNWGSLWSILSGVNESLGEKLWETRFFQGSKIGWWIL